MYQIRNLETGDRYVGQSMAIETRLREHKSQLGKGTHQCSRLQRAFKKYGADVFLFEILKSLPVDELDAAEQALLDDGFSAGNIYNTARYADAPARGTKHSDERKAQASAYRKKLFSDPVHLAKHAESIRNGMTAEVCAKISAGALADSKVRSERMQVRRQQWQQDGTMARAMAKRNTNLEWREKVQEHGRNWRSNADAVAAHDASTRARSENPEWQEQMRSQNKALANDETWREAVSAGHKTDDARRNHGEASRITHAKLKADPVRYAAWKQRIGDAKRARYAACRP